MEQDARARNLALLGRFDDLDSEPLEPNAVENALAQARSERLASILGDIG